MLASLSIRDVVLIERLTLSFGRGLSVLTGETGAGKSILLDALGLALGAITAGLTCAAVGYGLFQAWWLNSFILLAAVLAALGRPAAER